MNDRRGNQRFQWSLQTLFWLTFVVAVLCMLPKVLAPVAANFRPGFQPADLSRPLFAGLVVFLIVRWLIRHDRP